MGDADSEIIVPVTEIESWMDEALGVVDEGLDHLFLYMMNVNDRTKKILRKLENLEHLRRLFIAMHILIVPVVISILVCYSTRNTVDILDFEVYYQLFVICLMFLSGSLGLPLYCYSLWELFSANRQQKNDLAIRESVPRTYSGRLDSTSLSEDSFLTFISNEASLERLNDFARMLSRRMPGGMSTDIGRRRGLRFAFRNEESPEMGMISLLTDKPPSNPPSEGMDVEIGSTDLEFQETTGNLSDSEEKVGNINEQNLVFNSKCGKCIEEAAAKNFPKRCSDQVIKPNKNLESNLKTKVFSRNGARNKVLPTCNHQCSDISSSFQNDSSLNDDYH